MSIMIKGFEPLSETQFKLAKEAIAWITLLIATADGEMDEEEQKWAAKVTKIRGYHNPNELTEYYEAVGRDYSAQLSELMAKLPASATERRGILTRKLEQLNDVLPLLKNNLGHLLLKDYKSFAKHVAKASGGFMGFFSVSKEEASLIDLPMINAIPWEEPEEIEFDDVDLEG